MNNIIAQILKESHWIGKRATTKTKPKIDPKELNKYRILLERVNKKKVLNKILVLLDNPRMRKNDLWWARKIDSIKERNEIDTKDLLKNIRSLLRRNYPTAKFLKKILDYGVQNGFMALSRTLEMNKVRVNITGEKEKKIKTPKENEEIYREKEIDFEDLKKEIFKGHEPTSEKLKELKEKDPEIYKTFNRAKREKKKAQDDLRESLFHKEKKEFIEVNEFKKKMNEYGIDIPIDEGFRGSIDASGGYRTSEGRKILALVGKNVVMNPHYESSTDNTYYCSSINSSNNKVKHYTEDFFFRRKKEKYIKNVKFGQALDDIRLRISNDINSPDPKKQIMGTMVSLIDQAYFRIGNSLSEKHNVRGLHNLQLKHFKMDSRNRMHFTYTGKDKVHQHKIIADEKITSIMKELVKGKKRNDYIFTYGPKSKRIKPDDINKYMRDDLKAPVTIHKFRTYHATRLAKEFLDEIKMTRKVTKQRIMDAFKKSVDKIAKMMGHKNSGTTIKHYIDTTVLQEFFDRFKVEPPKVIANMTAVASLKNILKYGSEPFVEINSDHSITEEEEEFNNWLATLPEKILKLKAINMENHEEDEEEKYFI